MLTGQQSSGAFRALAQCWRAPTQCRSLAAYAVQSPRLSDRTTHASARIQDLQDTARAKIKAVDDRPGSVLSPRDTLQTSVPLSVLQSPKLAAPLVDTFGRMHDYLRISLTERCFYCMPEEGVELSPSSQLLSDDEIVKIATLFVRHGVRKIRLTGGEPTIRKGLVEFLGRLNELRSIGLTSIGMSTNGVSLHRQLSALTQNGLTHLNLSLDTLRADRFLQITRRQGHAAVLKSLDMALQNPGLKRIKLNVVVMRGVNDDEVLDFVELTRKMNVGVRFIEFMPFEGNRWARDKMVPSEDLVSQITLKYPDAAKIVDEVNDTARSYRIPGFQGTFGFISSMSNHFCTTCNRLRLTADGKIKVCLFDGAEISLKEYVGSDELLSKVIGYAVGKKKEKHEFMEQIDTRANRPMILIGAPTPRISNVNFRRSLSPAKISVGHCMPPKIALFMRPFSTRVGCTPHLTHIDASGNPSMVDVSAKAITDRSATASGRIYLTRHSFPLVYPNLLPPSDTPTDVGTAQAKSLSKGPVLTTANLSGILAAKQTSSIIPLCHPITITHISIYFHPEPDTFSVRAEATVRCSGKTGVEMEALSAVSGALLCIWDMVKAAAGREMRISDVMVVNKSGGASGEWFRESQ